MRIRRYLLLIVAIGATLCATATDRFYIEDFSIQPGETQTVSILLENETVFTAFQCDVYLPEGLTASNFALTDRKSSSHSFSANYTTESIIRLLSYSLQIKPFKGNSGALVTFDVTASDDFTGPVTIALRKSLFTTMTGVEVTLDDEECTVTHPSTVIRGDVNDDGAVTINDETSLIDYLLGVNVYPFNHANADVDGNNEISVADATALIDLLLSGGK